MFGVLSGKLDVSDCTALGKAPRRYNGKESGLVREIIQALNRHGAAFRTNAGSVKRGEQHED